MFRAALRSLKYTVAHVYKPLVDAIDLVAGYDEVFASTLGGEPVERHTAVRLFKHAHFPSLFLHFHGACHAIVDMPPPHRFLSSQSRLRNLGMRRYAADASEDELIDKESVRRTEYGAYVIHRPDVVRHDPYRQLCHAAVFVGGAIGELHYIFLGAV